MLENKIKDNPFCVTGICDVYVSACAWMWAAARATSSLLIYFWLRLMLLYYVTLLNLIKAQDQILTSSAYHRIIEYKNHRFLYFVIGVEHTTKKSLNLNIFVIFLGHIIDYVASIDAHAPRKPTQ